MSFGSARDLRRDVAEILRPPERISVTEAAERSVIVSVPGGYHGPWQASKTPYMGEPLNALDSREYTSVVFVGPAQSGKRLDVATKIPTPSGWTTMGDLTVGDEVFDVFGMPTEVVFATAPEIAPDSFEVEFSSGDVIVADAEHLWEVERLYHKAPHWRREVVTTAQMLRDLLCRDAPPSAGRPGGTKRYRYRVRNPEPLCLPEAELSIDPYVLGLWLGNGSANGNRLHCHEQDLEHYLAELERAGHRAEWAREASAHGAVVVVDGGSIAGVSRSDRRRFGRRLIDLEVIGNKHIPAAYLRASAHQRLELLRGLMDSDGHATGTRHLEFSTVSPALRDGIYELLASLGLKPRCVEKNTTWTHRGERLSGSAFRITFPAPAEFDVFRLDRKRLAVPDAQRDCGYRQVVDIRRTDPVVMRCIQVASESHVYLAGEGMIPTHNTQALLECWAAFTALSSPSDLMIVQTGQETARDYSRRRIDRMFRNSPLLGEKLSPRPSDDNVYDKKLRSGAILSIGWPSVSQLSGKSIKRMGLTDYDRFPEDVDGEGDAYSLAVKRTTVFMSNGMTLVESSPGYDIKDPDWKPSGHAAPPVAGGIFPLYNRGDRRLWYWTCLHCDEWFSPSFNLLSWVDNSDILKAAASVKMACPHCAGLIEHKRKKLLNSAGQWFREGELQGNPRRSNIASFWLNGAAAAFQTWESLVLKWLQAVAEYESTGSELAMKTTSNLDQGVAYMSRALQNKASPNALMSRVEDWESGTVPEGTILIASADVQKDRFEVQVHAFAPGQECWVVDRFPLRWSRRRDHEGRDLPLDPAAFQEDWDVLTDVLDRQYRTPAGDNLGISFLSCDSGGAEGVTERAYNWWRSLGASRQRVRLVKGEYQRPGNRAARVRETFPESGSKQGARGDVPLLLVNTNEAKDALHADLSRPEPGPGFIHLPSWLPDSFFNELTSEVRTVKGWQKLSQRARNEALDLLIYARAVLVFLRAERWGPAWENMPAWLRRLNVAGEARTAPRRERRPARVRHSSAVA